MGLSLASWAVYIVLRWAVASPAMAVVTLIPVLITGWAWGGPAGLLAAAAAVPVNVFGPWIFGHSDGPRLEPSVVMGSLAILLYGGIAVALRWLVDTAIEEVDDRRKAAAELDENRTRYESLHDGLPVGVYRSTPDGQILDANRALAEMLGFERVEDLMEMSAIELYVDPGERLRTQGAPESAGIVRGVEVRLRHRDGSVVWVRDSSRPVFSSDGELLYADGVLEDITEARRSKRARAAAETRFQETVQNSPIGMVIARLDGIIEMVNPAFCEMVGYSFQELIGTTIAAVTHPDDETVSARGIRAVARQELESFQTNTRFLHKDETEVWCVVTVTPLLDPDGSPERMLAQIVDVSDLKEAEQTLERLVRSKDEFVASVSHELRTPLTAVHGFASELRERRGDFGENEAAELVEMIADQSAEVANLVEDLLVSARAEIGQLVVAPTEVDLAVEVSGIIESFPSAVQVTVHAADGGPLAFADPVRLRQIVRNLLTNAERYGGSEVAVVLTDGDELVKLEVRDSGSAIPEEHRKGIFEAYQRLHDPAGQPAGVGLGLTVSRQLARLMNGDLEYRYDGRWSTFQLTLPAAGYHAPAGVATSEPARA